MTCKANNCYSNTNYSWSDYCSYHEKCLEKLRNRYGDFDDTPMLKVHPKAKNWEYFSSLITSPYVIRENLPCNFESGFFII